MKKAFALVLSVIMLFCICSASADTDKEIQFSGHKFGETMGESTQGAIISNVQFWRFPMTTRFLADPVSSELIWNVYQAGIPLVYQAQVDQSNGPTEVAGHQAGVNLYFYYPNAEDSADINLKNGIFYAGAYEFWDDPTSLFNDLKSKLTSVYGEPANESENGEEIWGELTFIEGASEEQVTMMLDEARNRYKVSFVVWKSSVNGAAVVLTKCDQNGWEYVRLYYIDTNAEEKIMSLYTENLVTDSPDNDSTDGL